MSNHTEGESDAYTVKAKEKTFTISDYPLLQTEFLYGSKTGMADNLGILICNLVAKIFVCKNLSGLLKHGTSMTMRGINNLTTQCFILGRVRIGF